VAELFQDLGLTPEVTSGRLQHHAAPGIDIFQGDIFDLTARDLGPLDAVFDRAALVALPPEMRQRYAAHLASVTDRARQLLICFEYDQSLMRGPPFSVTEDEVRALYGAQYDVTMLARRILPDGLRGRQAQETVWLLG
jgi:thiopurine S-methyltransferase